MSQSSPRLQLPYLQPAQAQKHVTHNAALQRLDALTQLTLEQLRTETPPPLPAEGALYGLGAAPTGAWAGHGAEIAAWVDGGWRFVPPQAGWRAWSLAEAGLYVWAERDGVWDWQPVLTQVEQLGIATAADAQNPFAMAGPASLFSHAGGGHQVKINRADATQTASVLFQSNWTGHAEIGLIPDAQGGTGFALKTSADGQTWQEVLRAGPSQAGLHLDGPLRGSAVQQDPQDATPDRVLVNGAHGLGGLGQSDHLTRYDGAVASQFLADAPDAHPVDKPTPARAHAGLHVGADSTRWMQLLAEVAGGSDAARLWWRRNYDGGISDWQQIFSQGNILGPVSESNGQPSGAIMEPPASGANGTVIRFANRLQLCMISALYDGSQDGPLAAGGSASGSWTFPAAFGSAPLFVSLSGGAATSGAEAAQHLGSGVGAVDATHANWSIHNRAATALSDARLDGFALGLW